MSSITWNSAAAHENYIYDGDGVRVATIATNDVLTAYFAGGSYEVTADSNGNETGLKKYYSLGGTTILDDGNGLKYMLTDHLGSVVSVTDDSGNLVSSQRYLPFGQVRADVGSITQTDFSFTGQRALNSGLNGLVDYRARFMDSSLGRFLQPDAQIPGASNPQAWNRYAYTLNDPINHTDPTGHSCVDHEYSGHHVSVCDTPTTTQALQEISNNSPTSGDALLEMFRTSALAGNDPKRRLETILGGTGTLTGNFAVSIGNTGLKDAVTDPVLTNNQVGHFLTAVSMAYNSPNSLTDIGALTLITGHEMVGDNANPGNFALTVSEQALAGATHPEARDLFLKGGDENFQKILGMGDYTKDRTGNSIQDLRLSKLGWDFGKLTQSGAFTSIAEQIKWLQANVVQ